MLELQQLEQTPGLAWPGLYCICAGHANDKAALAMLVMVQMRGEHGTSRRKLKVVDVLVLSALVPCARYANSTRQPQPRQPFSSFQSPPPPIASRRISRSRCFSLVFDLDNAHSKASCVHTSVARTHARTPSGSPSAGNGMNPSRSSTHEAPGVEEALKVIS
jgi:hypothetical protein